MMFQIPNVLRARNYRLYLSDGKRLVDLWLNGGAAVLGHTPKNQLRELKNTASRGLYAPFPHFTEERFYKALFKLFPQFNFRIYAAPPAELVATFSHRDTKTTKDTENIRAIKFWRPFLNPAFPFAPENAPLFIPILPGIQTWRDGLPYGLFVLAAKSENVFDKLPPSDILPPVLLAAATRGIYDLIAAPERAKPSKFIVKAIQESKWQRKGIYLTLKDQIAPEEWAELFNKFFDSGFLLPPSQAFPLILPGEMSKGEEAKLAAMLQGI